MILQRDIVLARFDANLASRSRPTVTHPWRWRCERSYTMPADGPCEKTELDETGAVVAMGGC